MIWAQKNLTNLTAVYLPGVQNVQADFLSRVSLDNKWTFPPKVFRWVLSLGVIPEVDLFASPCNFRLERYYTRSRVPRHSGRCSDRPLAVPQDLCLSPGSCHSLVSVEAQDGRSRDSGNSPILAKQAMVSTADATQLPGPSSSTLQTRPPITRGNSTSMPGPSTSDDLVLKRGRLEALGCPSRAISTLLNARKAGTNRVYQRIWKKFADYTSSTAGSCNNLKMHDILGFLQLGLDLSLSLSSLRVQLSAISAFTGVS